MGWTRPRRPGARFHRTSLPQKPSPSNSGTASASTWMDGLDGWVMDRPDRQTLAIGIIGLSWAREPFPLAAPAIAPALRPGSPLCPALHCP
ncbi:hypothetical protein CTRI78_v000552 [Colletotrichum trifolii]|uniref:Uncharacterized protein n=1 Tax=Colletotrichum trifolii TaxID=5466 RepID=A0A4R8RXW3_COLTR|nr:hypothetical protein CTRI78_v000552 [Colletotrichum trifolii]